jgi:hypothetical protein
MAGTAGRKDTKLTRILTEVLKKRSTVNVGGASSSG